MLATCSNILQLWNQQDYSLISDFGHDHLPSTDTIKSLDWKKDNSNYLVFTYKQTGRVQLYDIQKKKSVELSTTKAQSCSFSSSGKYLTVTNEDCQSQIWDVNSGRISQTFSSVDQSVMECICWGNGDSYLAAGTRNGNVFLYNQLTKQTFAAFTIKHDNQLSSISSIKWSPHKDLIGTTSIGGLLSLWNCRMKELVISIHSHKAPATDLAFSPHNDAFLVTAGMDGSLCCFDVTQQKILSTISVYAPLTSVDFHPNGSLVAVGTMGQSAAVYDLRDPKQKLAHLVNSNHSNVYAVRFDLPSSSSSSSSSSATTTLNRPTTLPTEKSVCSSKGLSTFAQQTIRSRHSSSSSSSATAVNAVCSTPQEEIRLPPSSMSSRERSLSSTINKKLNFNEKDSSTLSRESDQTSKNVSIPSSISGNCMSFGEFTQLCGLSTDECSSLDGQGHRRRPPGENLNQGDETLRQLFDERVNLFQEDLQEHLDKTKLAMKMNFTVQLERLRNDLVEQIESHSLNAQLIEEIQRLRAENQRLRQLQPRL